MADKITDRQQEYLEFIREYIWRFESAPRLGEIANHFGVKTPTAHKALSALQEKGLLNFGRDRATGFYIRIPERIDVTNPIFDINIVGKVNRYGEIFDIPNKTGHFPVILPNPSPHTTFAVELTDNITVASMQRGDFIVFDSSKKAGPGDIGIMWWGERWLIVDLFPVDQDPDTPWYIMSKESDPQALKQLSNEGFVYWWPLAVDEKTEEYFVRAINQHGIQWKPIAPEDIMAVAVQLEREMTI